jgi:hypothetical protein
MGFNLLRAETASLAEAIKINSQLIPSSGSSQGANYSFTDLELPEADLLFYWLEAVLTTDSTSSTEPLSLVVPDQGEPETPPPPETVFWA